ncbi:flavin-containing monooxygenase [Streptomyces flaveolus]|uniref:flavin-containing monooxygenase n=1 Tax=Streptomyces flaveolus TaxID=67297 RepID=UPI00380CE121
MVDEAFVRRAVQQADLNALRLALYHCTKSSALAEMSLTRIPVRGGATTMVVVEDKHHAEIRERAVRFLLDERNLVPEVTPDDAELRRMMQILTGETLSDKEFAYRRDVAAFDPIPREVRWHGTRPGAADDFSVTIVGAGFSGIAVGVQLARLGIDFTIYERRSELGGTWSVNQYPDCRVDTTNFIYQYTFEKKYPWTEYFARHHEVREYLERVAKKHGVYEHIVFDSEVSSARFDEDTDRWEAVVTDGSGRTTTVRSNLYVAASGLFGVPKEIPFDGAEEFEGEVVHTTRWNPEVTCAGRRVAVIGNGSTGVQLLSKVAAEAAHVDVYQRTPQWISPRERYGEAIPQETRWLIDTMPYYWNWYIYQMIAMGLGTQVMQEPDPQWKAKGGLINEANDKFRTSLEDYIKAKLGDRTDLVQKVTPDYAPIARRLIVDNNWYTSLLRDNVDLVTEGIERLTPSGIRTADGVERPVDLVIAAIGFQTTKYLWPTEYIGRGGVRLEDTWNQPGYGGPRAYLSLTVPGCPNLFICYGPNSQPRSGSLISWVEIWAQYIATAAVTMIEGGHSRMEVKKSVFDDYQAKLDKQSEKLIWLDEGAGREQNYYVNGSGRVQVGSPWRIEDYYELLAELRPEDFDLS